MKRRKEHHKYISNTRDLVSVSNEIIISLTNILYECIDISSKIQQTIYIKTVHEILSSNINLMELSFDYKKLLKIDLFDIIHKINLPLML